MSYMKKGLIVQNDSYMPVQKSLDIIAKSIRKVDQSLDEINERLNNTDTVAQLTVQENVDDVS